MRARVLVSLFLFSSLAYTAVWANNANGAVRGVSYGGKLCYLSSFMGTNNQVGFFQETVDTDNWMGPWTQYPDPTATIKLPKDWSFQNRTFQNEYGQGVVLFGAQLINVAIALDSKGNPWVVVTRYDLTKNEFLDCRGVLQLNYTRNDGYGVAATALNGNVYVFTGRFTLVSEDGYNYSQLSAVADGLSDYEAMDAVTFYPPEGPSKVLIAFSKRNSNDKAGYVIWDGSTLPMASSAFRTIGNDNEWYQAGATMLGTVKATQKYGCDFPSGNKHACVQLLLTAQSNFLPGSGWYVERYEYDTTTDTLQAMGRCPLTTPLIQFRAYPWFQTTPDSPDLGEFYVQEQLLVLNIWVCSGVNDCSGWHWNNFPLPSDFMVPQNQDTALGGYGWQGLPTSTVVSPQTPPDDIATYTTYWSLAGVVLGPPPFKTNGIQDSFELHDLSNVEYGMDSQNSLTHTVSWANSTMFSCQTEMKVGLGKKAGISSSFDLTYKQGWEGKNKDTTTYGGSISAVLGTESESDPDWGTHGYAIFVVPLLLTQDMAIYAYDYDFTTQTGTPLDQDLTTIVQAGSTTPTGPPPVNIETKYFSLQDPGGQGDEIPGLLNFPAPFPNATDLDSWAQTVWEGGNLPWEVIYGTGAHGGSQVVPFGMGKTDAKFTTSESTANSQGWSNAIEVQQGIGLFDKLKLFGIKASLTAGYSSEYSDMTTDESEVSQDLQLSLHLPIPPSTCSNPDYVRTMSIQPYLLQATDYTAPWIPVNYGLNLPWCITWTVSGTMCDGRRFGPSTPPSEIQGRIGGAGNPAEGAPAEAAGSKWSSYSIKGGRMVWKNPDGSLDPIPMTVEGFDPAVGATIKLNAHAFAANPSLGKWTREGQIWKFKSKGSAKSDQVTLKLDFGDRTWSFDGEKLRLSEDFKVSDSHATVSLCVNQKYTFRFDVEQAVQPQWELSLGRTDPRKLEVTKYSGSFGRPGSEDKILLEGTLPQALDGFGDLSFNLNGHQRDIPLLSLDGFQKALERGKELVYKEGGTHVVVDFGKRKWSAEFKKDAFTKLMAPRWGRARVAVKVGGATWYSQEHAIPVYTTKLSYKG